MTCKVSTLGSRLTGQIFQDDVNGFPSTQRKFIDWKKTKLFRFRWIWAEDQKLRGIRLQISSSPPSNL